MDMKSAPADPATHHEIRVKHIKSGSLFRLLLFTSCVIFLPVYLILGILGLAGLPIMQDTNGQHVSGTVAWKIALGTGFYLVIFFTLMGWCVIYIGMRLISLRWPISIKYHPHPDHPHPVVANAPQASAVTAQTPTQPAVSAQPAPRDSKGSETDKKGSDESTIV